MRFVAVALFTALFLCTVGHPARACFGPKLYLGADSSVEQQLLAAVVILYVKEKTGVEIEQVVLSSLEALAALQAERLDLAFAPDTGVIGAADLLTPSGLPRLRAGRRVREDLQFTTVGPALRKLDRLLATVDLRPLVLAVTQGEPPAATARTFLTTQGWL